jgi:hypothetical protein
MISETKERMMEALGIDLDGHRVKCGDCDKWIFTQDAIPDYEHETVRCQKCASPAEQPAADGREKPVDAVLWCPNCFEQHIDVADPMVCETCGLYGENECICDVFNPWLNPPHKSHRCNFCNHVWRPMNHPTNGVVALEKTGERDGFAQPRAFATKKDFDDAVEVATSHLERTIAELREQIKAANEVIDHYGDEDTWGSTDTVPDDTSIQDAYCGLDEHNFEINGSDKAKQYRERFPEGK